jgi:DnaK suppressor protein
MNEFTQTQTVALAQLLGTLDSQVRDDLRSALLQSGDQRYIDLAGSVHDLGDESVANMLTDLNSALAERHLQELREIEDARRRLAAGNINRCSECGGEIGVKRLLSYPVATRCIACQERHEKTHAHEATPRM